MMGNEEFLAVSAEYFFERPEKMKERHPDLHKALQYFGSGPKSFRQRPFSVARLTRFLLSWAHEP